MSEYKPITGEIREQMEQAERIYPIVDGMQNTQVRINLAWLTERLDAIDAIHAGLEAECERLREQDHNGWIELPNDAGGEYVHIGDVMDFSKNVRNLTVLGIGMAEVNDSSWGVFVREGSDYVWYNAKFLRHHKPDTWERIIEDAIDAVDNCWANDEHDKLVDSLVARCKALAGDAE